MPNTTDAVTITFDTTTHAIGISPDEIDVNYGDTDTITWTLSATGATIDSIDFGSNSPGPVTIAANGKTATLVDTDGNTGPANVEYSYTVYIKYQNQVYDSDPKIVNKPVTGGTGKMEGTA